MIAAAEQLIQPPPHARRVRTTLSVGILLFVSAQGDGFRSLGRGANDPTILTSGAVCLLLLLASVFRQNHPAPSDSAAKPGVPPLWRLLLLVAALLQASGAALLVAETHHYSALGYSLGSLPAVMVPLLTAAVLVWLALRRSPISPELILAGIVAAFVASSLVSLTHFPLSVLRSDMLPLIAAADASALAGVNPYHFYPLTFEVLFLTYLPGTWLAFIPAVLLHIDLRVIGLLASALTAITIFLAAERQYRRDTAALLGIFFCSPYLLYRHEIYTQPHWLVLSAALLLAFRGRRSAGAILMGVSIAMSQFSWVLLPFYLLFLHQRSGLRVAIRCGLVAATSSAVLIVPFLWPSPRPFFYGVLGHWQSLSVNARPVNLSLAVSSLVGVQHLQAVQAAVLVALLLFCVAGRRCRTPALCLQWMSVALLLFILLNVLVWGYFFLLFGLLLVLYTLAANGWLREDREPIVRPDSA